MTAKPLFSIIIPTLNNELIISKCLGSIRSQTFKNVEIVVADGHSTDKTREICLNYGATIIDNDEILAEPGVRAGLKASAGKYCMVMAADNELLDSQAVDNIVAIFTKHPQVVAVIPQHESTDEDNLITKYTNTFTDPYSHYVYLDAANGRTFSKIYNKIYVDSIYSIYDFKSNISPPLIALAQGFSFHKNLFPYDQHKGDDIVPIMELLQSGHQLAYANGIPVGHHTIRGLGHFIRKTRWATHNALTKKAYGMSSRSKYLSSEQKMRQATWPIYGISFIGPFLFSIYQCIRSRNSMWLLHAPLSFISVWASIYELMRYNLNIRSERVSRS